MGMKKHTENWVEKFIPESACTDAVEWCRTQRTAKEAWDKCPRGDWLLWLLAQNVKKGSTKHRRIVLAACACARLSLKYAPEGEGRPLKAIETAESWAKRKKGVTLEDVRRGRAAAADAAYAAADAAYAAYAAADAAAYAAAAAYADAAAVAAYAAYAAANAAAYADAAAYAADAWVQARGKVRKECADIVRGIFKFEEVVK